MTMLVCTALFIGLCKLIKAVTLLAIFACNAIAVPLSPSFPAGELKYILDNSSARFMVATEKYAGTITGVLKAGLEHEPFLDVRPKLLEGATGSESVQLKDLDQPSSGGMMLYTSGTTNRPVRHLSECKKSINSL